MYEINDQINTQEYDQLKIHKFKKIGAIEVLSISLEKDAIFPEHTSPTDAQLILLEGAIDFHINGETFHLKKQQHFSFPQEEEHWVEAIENSRFLIIR
ncbi:cupin domain-containing protein [Maribacter sp. 2304DJ31-5]|uniref:cupin domain-containing protein n=1 Tax=Maribacter sp. 2304DJ31-5 TaxID=3386273 RepID=UPI0039BCE791